MKITNFKNDILSISAHQIIQEPFVLYFIKKKKEKEKRSFFFTLFVVISKISDWNEKTKLKVMIPMLEKNATK